MTAWGPRCGKPRSPGVYASVYHFKQNGWLQETFEHLNSIKEFEDCDPAVIPNMITVDGVTRGGLPFLNGNYTLMKVENAKTPFFRLPYFLYKIAASG